MSSPSTTRAERPAAKKRSRNNGNARRPRPQGMVTRLDTQVAPREFDERDERSAGVVASFHARIVGPHKGDASAADVSTSGEIDRGAPEVIEAIANHLSGLPVGEFLQIDVVRAEDHTDRTEQLIERGKATGARHAAELAADDLIGALERAAQGWIEGSKNIEHYQSLVEIAKDLKIGIAGTGRLFTKKSGWKWQKVG